LISGRIEGASAPSFFCLQFAIGNLAMRPS
jgi:hypothetical protein